MIAPVHPGDGYDADDGRGPAAIAGLDLEPSPPTSSLAWARRAARAAATVLYPPACVACAAPTLDAFGLCGPCWRDAGFLSGLVCDLCGTPLPGEDGGRPRCDDCLATPRPWSRGRSALAYRGTARTLVLALKHGDRTDLARAMGGWMAAAARPLLEDGRGDDPVLVPVPLHWTRLLARRYNQAALLADAAGRALGLAVLPDALVRPRRTGPRPLGGFPGRRSEPGRAARLAALDGAIAPHARRGAALDGRAVILVDDVMTTGATLMACARAATAAGARDVRVLILARAARDG